MSFSDLNDRLLKTAGILERLQGIQSDLKKIPPEHYKKAYEKKLNAIREDLASIFFEAHNEEDISEILLKQGAPFQPDYPELQATLSTVFFRKTTR